MHQIHFFFSNNNKQTYTNTKLPLQNYQVKTAQLIMWSTIWAKLLKIIGAIKYNRKWTFTLKVLRPITESEPYQLTNINYKVAWNWFKILFIFFVSYDSRVSSRWYMIIKLKDLLGFTKNRKKLSVNYISASYIILESCIKFSFIIRHY